MLSLSLVSVTPLVNIVGVSAKETATGKLHFCQLQIGCNTLAVHRLIFDDDQT